MSPLELVIFDTDPRGVESLRRNIDLPFVRVVQGDGSEVTASAKLDAMWDTWMMAERSGITPVLVPYRAEVFPNADPFKGLPPFIVAGVNLAPKDRFGLGKKLEINLDGMLEAVTRFNSTSSTPISRLGTLPGTSFSTRSRRVRWPLQSNRPGGAMDRTRRAAGATK